MKKLLAIILAGFSLVANAQSKAQLKPAPQKTILNCTVHGDLGSGMFLHELKNGEAVSLGWKRPDANGKITFEVDLQKEGIFFIRKAGGKGADFKYSIYLKAGDQTKIDFYVAKSSIEYDSMLVQKPNVENKALMTWLTAMNDYKHGKAQHTVDPKKYADFEKVAATFLKENKTGNAYFNTWMNDKVQTDLIYLKAFHYFGARNFSVRDTAVAVQSFYKSLEDKQIASDPRILRSENGMKLLRSVFAYWRIKQGVTSTQALWDASLSLADVQLINNNAVKVAYLMYRLPEASSFQDFQQYAVPNKALFVTPEQKAIYAEAEKRLGIFAKGSPGFNFNLNDVNDQLHTLESFKGKVVVLDLWAMWCASCLKQKPLFYKIEEEYKHRDDIVFIGVSMDNLNRKENWKEFVKKNGFTGIELLSDSQGPASLLTVYNNKGGIPRYMIFDREGKVVSVDMPQPINPEFKKLIDETLAAK